MEKYTFFVRGKRVRKGNERVRGGGEEMGYKTVAIT